MRVGRDAGGCYLRTPMGNAPDGSRGKDETTSGDVLRSHQANERTLLAWIRTGVAMMGLGFVVARFGLFLREIAAVSRVPMSRPSGIGSLWVGAGLTAIGALTIVGALLRYIRVREALVRGEPVPIGGVFVYVVAGFAAAIGLVLVVVLVANR